MYWCCVKMERTVVSNVRYTTGWRLFKKRSYENSGYIINPVTSPSDSNIVGIESSHPENGDKSSRRNIEIYALHNNSKDNYFNQAHPRKLENLNRRALQHALTSPVGVQPDRHSRARDQQPLVSFHVTITMCAFATLQEQAHELRHVVSMSVCTSARPSVRPNELT
jgi:hypothetical protein